MRNFADRNNQHLRWNLKLSELDFFVQDRPESKIANVEALSRYVGTVTHYNCLV